MRKQCFLLPATLMVYLASEDCPKRKPHPASQDRPAENGTPPKGHHPAESAVMRRPNPRPGPTSNPVLMSEIRIPGRLASAALGPASQAIVRRKIPAHFATPAGCLII